MIKLNTVPASQDFDAYNSYSGIVIDDANIYLQNDSGRGMMLEIYMTFNGAIDGKRFTTGAAVTVEAWVSDSLQTVFSPYVVLDDVKSWTEPSPSIKRTIIFKNILLPDGYTLFLTASSDDALDTDIRINNITIYDNSSSVISRSASGLPDVNVNEILDSAVSKSGGNLDVNVETVLEATPISRAEIRADSDSALSAYDSPTKAEMDTGHGLLATEAKQDISDGIVDAILTDTGTSLPASFASVQDSLININGNVDQIEAAVITNADGTDIAADIIAVKVVVDAINILTKAAGNGDLAAILADTGTTLPGILVEMQGASFDSATDSLKSIRDRGDAAWGSGAGIPRIED